MQNDKDQQDNTCGEGRISRESAMPLPQGGGAPALPSFLDCLLFMHTPFDAEPLKFNVVIHMLRGACF